MYKRKTFKIDNRGFREQDPAFIIAELSANHLHDYELAVKTVRAMKDSGADAVKLQTYTPDTVTIDCDSRYFKIRQGTIWDGRTLYQLYKEAYTPWEWIPRLKKIAQELGLVCFSSVNDRSAVDFMEKCKVKAYKLPSFEITDIPLIEYVASKQKPIILSTGIAEISDISEAVNACRRMGNDRIAILKCTSAYPAPLREMNLRTIPDLKKKFGAVVGLSDHTLNGLVPVAAVGAGAKIIEKHFILDRSLGGPDAAFSLQPEEFKEMVRAVREAEAALGKVSYELSAKTKKNREFCRSLFAVRNIGQGESLTEENIRSIRPGYGLHPRHLRKILGKKARKSIKKGTPLNWSLIKSKS
jgi:pseudaminic acid synthase